MAKEPSLLVRNKTEFTTSLRGMAYVKNSEGRTGNISFFTSCTVNTSDNTVKVTYKVEVFKEKKSDSYSEVFTDYSKACDKYDELATK